MPILEYVCEKNQHRFERIVTKYSAEPQKCPKCGSMGELVDSVPAKRNPDFGIQR